MFLFWLWLAATGWVAAKTLIKVFPLNKSGAIFLGVGFSFLLLGLVANIFTAWFKYEWWLAVASALIVSVFWVVIEKYFNSQPQQTSSDETDHDWPKIFWVIFYLAMVSGIVAPIIVSTGDKIVSPWQVLPWWFIASAAAGFLFLLWSIASNIKASKLLPAIIIFSFLIHGYLLVYHNGFGGDRFRHLGSENRILQGIEYQPTFVTTNLWWTSIGSISIPQVLIDRVKVSYGFQWSLEVIASQITGIGVFQINRFLMPLLWSLLLTFFTYVAGVMIFDNKSKALFAALLSNSFYLLQYYGAQGLPASYGLLVLAGNILWWLAYLKTGKKQILAVAIGFTILSYFNYSLAFLRFLCSSIIVLISEFKSCNSSSLSNWTL
jgi:hypothetical protein